MADWLEKLLEGLGDVRIKFWICPVDGHSDSRTDTAGRPVATVQWSGDVASCTFPGCGRTSQFHESGESGDVDLG